MLVDNSFLGDENVKRFSLGLMGAMLVHGLVLIWLSLPASQKIISPDMFSPPTRVAIRFVTPVAEKPKVKEKPKPVPKVPKVDTVKKEPVVKKLTKAPIKDPLPEILDKIEPAAAPRLHHQPPPPTQQKPVEVSKPVLDIIPVVSEARLKGRRVKPKYPKRSLRMRQEGIVLLHVLISKTGAQQEIKLHKPSRYALLNQAAVKAVKKWTFDPNIVNGQAIQSWVEIPIEFKIQ